MFQLKDYQARALNEVESFFRDVRVGGRDAAWAARDSLPDYNTSALGDVPAVCVRIPTGGGKTFLAAQAIPRIGQVLCDTDAPVALWLVPSDAIRTQTLAALQSPRHPCRVALESHFGDRLRVCSIDELANIGRHEFGQSAIVVVATIQAFNVREKARRTVYSFDESLAAHFEGLTPGQIEALDTVGAEDIAAQPFLTSADLGRVKASIANLLSLAHPIVIVDEAHNNRTEQAYRTLRNLNPACVLEFTATPAASSNVLFHVSATELQREEMIKLPIVLMEHPTGWKDAVRDAILVRRRLEMLAQNEDEYLRPILLIQAEPKGGEATVEALLAHLMDEDGEKLPREQIAIATSAHKELDGVVLADPACLIRYVVTVEALKEGWDCPFAYVLCVLQDSKSDKDVEQLLGRVLRMPYAKSRQYFDLNRAYAHVVKQGVADVAANLVDSLVQNMGFETFEAVQAVVPPLIPEPPGTAPKPAPPTISISLPVPPPVVPPSLQGTVRVVPTMGGSTVIYSGSEITDEFASFVTESVPPPKRPQVETEIEKARLKLDTYKSPAMRRVPFAPVPNLCMTFDDVLQRAEPRLLAQLGDFDLLAEPISLEGFRVVESGRAFEIDVVGGSVRYSPSPLGQLHLNSTPIEATENDLVRWLDRECRQQDVAQPSMLKWMMRLVSYLLHERHMTLTTLFRARHQLKTATQKEIDRRRQLAVGRGFQAALPGLGVVRDGAEFRYAFHFSPDGYGGRPPYYTGRYRFQKHYYGVIHDLRSMTQNGEPAEEFLCAQAIDLHRAVKHWVRNPERERNAAFWLPTATDLFYPDFVCELLDGRVLVVEYKGNYLVDNEDSREKRLVGEQWERSSGGRCLFLMATIADDRPTLPQQLAAKIGH